ncbi:Heme oxygenase [Gemmata obscuriglobus]|uniref:Biliverdin-producing heme oxygenase n=1 Tax=Gemmata obscuriglobus TaxID=114 RepID=A0A2Z3H3Q6_9BACT|nr:biliverdin-producing heme oxygenase [Gemmata obscuriglobus]AWM38357.1 biliverdin-producing heme oxygenase [Gemmata obscuriglobus]QEG28727.1 Heme oxygenase [Gemmata obscuriglobus]VTS07017.1 heme oxygenase : Heme oxygenase OS=Deinococcus peraridilitoris (strain DSM 19664 / LMG 22246 / CIP 109416 / KR-200) GN=Deipe_2750 PE=4 SV=1: Heme_oxygenase: Heme_oxygenase [Gemmata obscuriglobus UQM 2246]
MILDRLKETTAEQHARLERRVDLGARLRGPSEYAELLGHFYGFYRPLEAALSAVSGYESVGLAFMERCKIPHLASDLSVLGRSPAHVPLDAAPPIGSLGAALGRMYVLEGATLGGRVVCRMVREALGYTPDRGCRFFNSYGDRVGPMWTAFRAALVRFATTPEAETEVVNAAGDTFDRFDRWLVTRAAT